MSDETIWKSFFGLAWAAVVAAVGWINKANTDKHKEHDATMKELWRKLGEHDSKIHDAQSTANLVAERLNATFTAMTTSVRVMEEKVMAQLVLQGERHDRKLDQIRAKVGDNHD